MDKENMTCTYSELLLTLEEGLLSYAAVQLRILCYPERHSQPNSEKNKVTAVRAWRLGRGKHLFSRYGVSVQEDNSVLEISLITWYFLFINCILERGHLVLYVLSYHNSSRIKTSVWCHLSFTCQLDTS